MIRCADQTAPRFSRNSGGQKVCGEHRPLNRGQPHLARLLHGFFGRADELREMFVGPIGRPANNGSLRVQQRDSIDADLGQLLNDPLWPIELGHRETNRDWRIATRVEQHVAVWPNIATGRPAESPRAGTVRDGHGRPVGDPEHTKDMMRSIVIE